MYIIKKKLINFFRPMATWPRWKEIFNFIAELYHKRPWKVKKKIIPYQNSKKHLLWLPLGRSDVVAELAELYRQEGILQEARGLGGVDAAFLKNAYAGVDRLADTDIESAEMLRKVLGSIEQHFGESKVSGDIIAQLENKVKEQRAREYG